MAGKEPLLRLEQRSRRLHTSPFRFQRGAPRQHHKGLLLHNDPPMFSSRHQLRMLAVDLFLHLERELVLEFHHMPMLIPALT